MNQKERILLWSSNLWMFSDGLLGPLFAVFTAEIGGSILDITAAWAIFTIVTGILTIVVGKVADRIGHERLLVSGYGLNAVFTFAYLWVDGPMDLFIVQAGLGLSLALANPTWAALYDRFSNDKKDGALWGAAYGHASIATGVATIAGGYIVTRTSFEVLFILMGTLQVFATLLQLKLNRVGIRRGPRRA
jgi:MFS family permease